MLRPGSHSTLGPTQEQGASPRKWGCREGYRQAKITDTCDPEVLCLSATVSLLMAALSSRSDSTGCGFECAQCGGIRLNDPAVKKQHSRCAVCC